MKIVLLFLIAVVIAVAAITVAIASMTYLAVGIAVILIAVALAVLLKLPPWFLVIIITHVGVCLSAAQEAAPAACGPSAIERHLGKDAFIESGLDGRRRYFRFYSKSQGKGLGFSFEELHFLATCHDRMDDAVLFVERAISGEGMASRVFTKGRTVALVVGLVVPPAAATVAVGLAAHNLATLNPDYEVMNRPLDKALREGGMSIHNTPKTLAVPDEGVSLAQAADAATKTLA